MKAITVKFLALLLAVTAVLPLAGCGKNEDGAPMGFIEISDEALTYHLYVPDEWTPDLSTGVTSAYFDGRDPSNISMTAFELDRSVAGIDDYWALYEADFKQHFPDMEYVDTADTTLGGAPAKQYIYTVTLSDAKYKIMQIVSIKSNQVYIFTYTAVTDRYDAHIEDVLSMLDFFTFK